MNRWAQFKPIFLLSILITLFACAKPRPDQRTDSARQAESVSRAFAEADAKAWRLGTAKELALVRALPTKDVDRALLGYRDVIAKRGAQGLEPLVLAAVSELASRGWYESERAKEHLSQLRKEYRIDDKVGARPNAYAPIMRPQNRQVHYVPLSVAQGLLQQAMVSGHTGLNRLAADTLCSEQAIFDFRQRWGDAKANVLEELCRGDQPNAALDNAFPGIASGISAYDCEISQEPTRAERLTSAMQACLQSTVADGGGNPLGSGGIWRDARWGVFPMPEYLHIKDIDEQAQLDSYKAKSGHFYEDNAGRPVMLYLSKHDGSDTYTFFRENGDEAITYSHNGEGSPNEGAGNLTHRELDTVTGAETHITNHVDKGGFPAAMAGKHSYSEARVDGKVVERIDMHEDGGYTVTRPGETSRTYDKYNNLVPPSIAPVPRPKSADPTEWGATAECQALNRMLAEERVRGDLESNGIVSPKAVNPNPDTGNGDGEGVPCFASINISIDSGLPCTQLTSSCPVNFIVNEQCGCDVELPAAAPSSNCQYLQMCSDGSTSIEDPQTGVCGCGNGEPAVFVDPWAGGGPEPEPSNRLTGKNPFE